MLEVIFVLIVIIGGSVLGLLFLSNTVNLKTIEISSNTMKEVDPLGFNGFLTSILWGFKLNQRHTKLADLEKQISRGQIRIRDIEAFSQYTTQIEAIAKQKKQILDHERRIRSLVSQKNTLMSANSNDLKTMEDRERNFLKKKKDFQNKVETSSSRLDIAKDLEIKMSERELKLREDLALLIDRENDLFLKEDIVEKIESFEALAKQHKLDQARMNKREKALSNLEDIERAKGQLEGEKIITNYKQEGKVNAKKIIEEAKKQAKNILDSSQEKERVIKKTLDTLTKKTPIENIELALSEKYSGVKSIAESEQESLAHICFIIKDALDSTENEVPEFLQKVAVAPDIHHMNQVKTLMEKIASEITNIKDNTEINEDEKMVLLEQWEEYREREFSRIMDT